MIIPFLFGFLFCLSAAQQQQQHGQVPQDPHQQQLNAQQQAQQQAQMNAQQQQQQYQQQQQQQQGNIPQPPGHRNFAANEELQDQQHINSHLEGTINVDESKMTNEQLQFHYFTMHDLNKDQRLDGIELIKAITHWHGDENQQNYQPPKVTDTELEDMIDSILKDDDFDNDGFVDYSEFLKSQAARS